MFCLNAFQKKDFVLRFFIFFVIYFVKKIYFPFVKFGKKTADPLKDQSKILMLKRSYHEKSMNRKYSSIPKQASSFGKVLFIRNFKLFNFFRFFLFKRIIIKYGIEKVDKFEYFNFKYNLKN